MNKIILVVSLLALALSTVNTVLLVQMGATIKEAAHKLEPVAKAVGEIQPVLQELSEKRGVPPPGKLPVELPKVPGDLKPKALPFPNP